MDAMQRLRLRAWLAHRRHPTEPNPYTDPGAPWFVDDVESALSAHPELCEKTVAQPPATSYPATNTMRAALHAAACQFEYYAYHHREKGNHDKAETNAELARMCREALVAGEEHTDA